MPPPNITGILHMGHALFATLQDISTRYHRMAGDCTLWLPGADHAGLATHAKLVQLMIEKGINPDDPAAYDAFAETYKKSLRNTISGQLRSCGASADWSRETFTLDEGYSKAVLEAMKRCHGAGMLYKQDDQWWLDMKPLADRLISELDAGNIEIIPAGQEGTLRNFIENIEPWCISRQIRWGHKLPIWTKPADQNFQPNCDAVRFRWQFAQRMSHFAISARKLFSLKYDTSEISHFLSSPLRWSKSNTDGSDSPQSTQGLFRLCSNMISRSARYLAAETGALFAASRSRLAAYHFRFDSLRFSTFASRYNLAFSRFSSSAMNLFMMSEKSENPQQTSDFSDILISAERPGEGWTQEQGCLDTWFSSALWPFATLGWPEDTEDMRRFYPAAMIETADDILFFWCARMLMMGLLLTDQLPFKTIFLHGLIRDKHGKKMSKSEGNGIDPLDIIDRYGADSMRFALAEAATPGQDMRMWDDKFQAGKALRTKFWNASRYALSHYDRMGRPELPEHPFSTCDDDHKMVSLTCAASNAIQAAYKGMRYHEAAHLLRRFIFDDLCGWYIEATKGRLYDSNDIEALYILMWTLDQTCRMAHPIMPFITERIRGTFSDTPLITDTF